MPRKKLAPKATVIPTAPVLAQHVHPLVMAKARELAGDDMRRVTLVSSTEVIVR